MTAADTHAGRNPSQCDGITARLTPVMTIMGLLCTPDVARRAQAGELGLDTSSPVQIDQMNAAYGLIAQVVWFLGIVLDVPPLFHIRLGGSYCSIQQHIPRFARLASVEADSAEVRARRVSSAVDAVRFACACRVLGHGSHAAVCPAQPAATPVLGVCRRICSRGTACA